MGHIHAFQSNIATEQCNTIQTKTLIGNIVPREWYQVFTNGRGGPDLSLISVLSEIVYWYRPKVVKDKQTDTITYANKFPEDAWQTSYQHFEGKFLFLREKLRRIFVKLESLGIIKREFRNVSVKGQIYSTRLFIHFSNESLKNYIENKSHPIESTQAISSPQIPTEAIFYVHENEGGGPRFGGAYNIDNKNKDIKDRSMQSNFIKISQEEVVDSCLTTNYSPTTTEERISCRKNLIIQTKKTLEDFYPLSQEDYLIIQKESGRNFTLQAMNEILKDMSRKLFDRTFFNKKMFIKYISKAFMYEKRIPEQVSSDSFKIRANATSEEKKQHEIERYLNKIECSLEVSKEMHFKKKLCSTLKAEKAYELLHSYKYSKIENDTFHIVLSKQVELDWLEENIILKQAKASHEETNPHTRQIIGINKLNFTIKQERARSTVLQNSNELDVLSSMEGNIWERTRNKLRQIYGDAVDRNWFAQLDASINDDAKKINLSAPNNFIKDWIERNYMENIRKTLTNIGYNYEFNIIDAPDFENYSLKQ
jgi:hypothetical protein